MRKHCVTLAVMLCVCMLVNFTGVYADNTSGGADVLVPQGDGVYLLNIDYERVICVDIRSLGIGENYDYSISIPEEMLYFMHYLSCIEIIDDGKNIKIYDGSEYDIKVFYEDYSFIRLYSMIPRVTIDGKQYKLSDIESWKRFLNLVNAFKTGKFKLKGKITFTPSEWAESYVADAIERGFVPKLNQINYTGDITRLEVCQLAAEFLRVQGYKTEDGEEKPFTDTNDSDVILLYNAGVIDGKSDTEFYPYDFITREELAKVLSNLHTLTGGEKAEQSEPVIYADSDKISGWATKYIDEMSTLGILKGDEKGNFNPESNTTKEQVIITLLRMAEVK